METAISRHPPPPGICTRQTSSLHGWGRARGPAQRRSFDRTSMMQNDHRHIPHHRQAPAEAGFDNMNSPPPVKMRGNMEGREVEEIKNPSIYDRGFLVEDYAFRIFAPLSLRITFHIRQRWNVDRKPS